MSRTLVSRVTRAVFGAAALLLVAYPVSGGNYTWTTEGPETGYISAILVNPGNSNRILASSGRFSPMVFETDDGGQSWRQIESLAAYRFAQDPSRADVLYAATPVGVSKSIDGGANWFPANAGLPSRPSLYGLAIAPSAPDTLYVFVVDPLRVFRSTDGGDSWQLRGDSPVPEIECLVVDPLDPSVLYAGFYDGVSKSIDGGTTWASIGPGERVNRLAFAPSAPQTLYAGTDTGLFRTLDGGAVWSPANTGIEDRGVLDLAVHPSDPLSVYVATTAVSPTPGGLFRTTDAGAHWTSADLGTLVGLASAVTYDPQDPSRIFAGAGAVFFGNLFKSVDGGTIWVNADRGLGGGMCRVVEAHPSSPDTAFAFAFPSFYRNDGTGAGWSPLGTLPSAFATLAIDPSNPDIQYAGVDYGYLADDEVYKSVDGGATWNPATLGLSVSQLWGLVISPSSPDKVFAATQDGLFGTVNAAASWDPLLPGNVRSAAVDPLDGQILYAGLDDVPGEVSLERSPDGGLTWDPPAGFPASGPVRDLTISPAAPDRVYATFSFGVYRSLDRGLSFEPASGGLPTQATSYLLASDPVDDRLVYLMIIGPNFGEAYRSPDGADSWKPLPSQTPGAVFSAPFGISVGSDGRSLYAATDAGIFQFHRAFLDVPDADPFWSAVDVAAMNGVTVGCGRGNFCPRVPVSRASIAAFLLHGKNGPAYEPPPATGTVFSDVPASSLAAAFIEELFHAGITSGCGGGAYCPAEPVTRAQFAVFLLKTEHGAAYEPPPATGAVFADVPADAFAAAWIEQLAAEGVTAGCGGGNFCPGDSVLRAQAAALVVRALGLS